MTVWRPFLLEDGGQLIGATGGSDITTGC